MKPFYAGLFLLLLCFPAAANDLFTDRTILDDGFPITVSSTHLGATGGEIHSHLPSRWWSWKAPQSGWHEIILESDLETQLVIYQGSELLTLTTVNHSRWSTVLSQTKVPFPAQGGKDYQIAILGSADGELGSFRFTLSPSSNPSPNDDFSDSIDLGEAINVTLIGETAGATAEPGEPFHHDREATASVWWTFSPAQTCHYEVLFPREVAKFSAYQRFAIYEGTGLNTLRSITSFLSGRSQTFEAEAGKRYHLVMDRPAGIGRLAYPVEFRLKAIPVPDDPPPNPPPNDLFADATNLGPVTEANFEATLGSATRENGELYRAGTSGIFEQIHQTVWWRWECPEPGSYAFDLGPLGVFHHIHARIARQKSNGELEDVFLGKVHDTMFEAHAGEVYYFMTGSLNKDATHTVRIRFTKFAPSLNRTFSSALSLGSVDDFEISGETFTDPGRSLSWEWTPLSGGIYRIHSHSGIPSVVRIYETDPEGLSTEVFPANDHHFFLEAGSRYAVILANRLPGFHKAAASLVLPSPANDHFSGSLDLGSANFVRSKSHTFGSSLEEDELETRPPHSIWWKWRAPSSGAWELRCFGERQAWIEIFRGSALDSLEPVSQSAWSYQLLNLQEGELYHIRLTSYSQQETQLTINEGLQSPNDLRIDATDLGNASVAEGRGNYFLATSNHSEPADKTLWWRWTAPTTGYFRVSASGRDNQVHLYQGRLTGPFEDLVPFQVSQLVREETFVFEGSAGQEYLILTSGSGVCHFSLAPIDTPVGDSFEGAIDLGDRSGVRYQGDARNATIADSDPVTRRRYSGSIWLKWEAPATGIFEIENMGESEDAIGIYTFDDTRKLVAVSFSEEDEDEDQFLTKLSAEKGRIYYLAYFTEENLGWYQFQIDSGGSYERWVESWQDRLAWQQLPPLTPEETDRLADPLGDGISNFTKYVFGLNPTNDGYQNETGSLPRLMAKDGYLEMHYRLGSFAAKASTIRIRHFGEWSEDGRTWNAIAPQNTGGNSYRVRVPIDDGRKLLRVRTFEEFK